MLTAQILVSCCSGGALLHVRFKMHLALVVAGRFVVTVSYQLTKKSTGLIKLGSARASRILANSISPLFGR